MAFECPDCHFSGALKITHRLSLPGDVRSDDIALQVVECGACGFRGAAVYEESRRGVLDSESWDHVGYRLTIVEVEWLISTVERCPDPGKSRCACAAHRQFGWQDDRGRWQLPAGINWSDAFAMRPDR